MKHGIISVMTFMCLAVFGESAFAQIVRIPAPACQIISDAQPAHDGSYMSTTERRGHILCPIVDSFALSQGSINRFNVHYYDGHDGQSVQAQPCVKYYSAFGGTCAGLFQENQDEFTGVGTLQYPFFNLWSARSADFAYISINLTQQNCEGSFLPRICHNSFFFGVFGYHVSSQAASAAAASPQVSLPPDAEVDRAALIQEFEARIAAHATEQHDSAWGAQTSNGINQTLQALQQEGDFTLLELDCRSRTCLARLQWNNLSAAERSFGKLLTADFGASLATEILFRSPPINLSEKYEEVMYFSR